MGVLSSFNHYLEHEERSPVGTDNHEVEHKDILFSEVKDNKTNHFQDEENE